MTEALIAKLHASLCPDKLETEIAAELRRQAAEIELLQQRCNETMFLTSAQKWDSGPQAMNAAVPFNQLMSGPHGLQPIGYYERLFSERKV